MDELSVVKKMEWLKAILASPHTLSKKERDNAIEVCKSQGSLAKFNSEEFNIHGSSLNTLKAHAVSRLQEGFSGLDRLRKSVLLVLTEVEVKTNAPGRGTRASYIKKSEDQKKEIQWLTDELQLMTVKLEDILAFTRSMSKKYGEEASYKKMYREVFSKFS